MTNLPVEMSINEGVFRCWTPFLVPGRLMSSTQSKPRPLFFFHDLQSSGQADSERAAHAMADPEIQAILTDPMVRQVLTDFKENPQHAQKVSRMSPTVLFD